MNSASPNSFVLVDTGVLSRFFLQKPQIVAAYNAGLGDCFTIGVALFFDIPVFTLNQKHFERVPGIRLHRPDNYERLETN